MVVETVKRVLKKKGKEKEIVKRQLIIQLINGKVMLTLFSKFFALIMSLLKQKPCIRLEGLIKCDTIFKNL